MRKIFALLGATMLVAALAACGGDSGSSGTTTTGSTTTTAAGGNEAAPVTLEGTVTNHGTKEATGGSIDMEADNDGSDFYFAPTFVKAAGGTTVTVHIKNEGSVAHTFTIDSMNIDKELQPDDSADIEVTLPASGATPFYCKFHKSSGMQGAFFANEGDTVNP
jgi:plastocyanin